MRWTQEPDRPTRCAGTAGRRLVNLGIGLPTLVAAHLPQDAHLLPIRERHHRHAPVARGRLEDEDLTDAGGGPSARCRARRLRLRDVLRPHPRRPSRCDGAGRPSGRRAGPAGQLDGAGQDGSGHGRRDGSGVRRARVIVAMTHRSPSGSKMVKRCTLPITSTRRVDLIVTELAVIRPTPDGLLLMETMPGVSVRDVIEASDARIADCRRTALRSDASGRKLRRLRRQTLRCRVQAAYRVSDPPNNQFFYARPRPEVLFRCSIRLSCASRDMSPHALADEQMRGRQATAKKNVASLVLVQMWLLLNGVARRAGRRRLGGRAGRRGWVGGAVVCV